MTTPRINQRFLSLAHFRNVGSHPQLTAILLIAVALTSCSEYRLISASNFVLSSTGTLKSQGEKETLTFKIASKRYLNELLVTTLDTTHGRMQRELYSRRQTRVGGVKLGAINRIERRYNLPSVMIGSDLDREAKKRADELQEWKDTLSGLPDPPRAHSVPDGDGGREVYIPEDPHYHTRRDLKRKIGNQEQRTNRLVRFLNRHRKQADSRHSIALVLEHFIVDAVHVPVLDDPNITTEAKFFVYWKVVNGDLKVNLSPLQGDDFRIHSGHPVAFLAFALGIVKKNQQPDIARELTIKMTFNPLESKISKEKQKIARTNGLDSSDLVKLNDLELRNGDLYATVSWRKPIVSTPDPQDNPEFRRSFLQPRPPVRPDARPPRMLPVDQVH